MQCDTQRDFLCEKPEMDTAATATTTATAAAGACSCGAGWTGSLDTGRCYLRGEAGAGLSWAEARARCRDLGADLASVASLTENWGGEREEIYLYLNSITCQLCTLC